MHPSAHGAPLAILAALGHNACQADDFSCFRASHGLLRDSSEQCYWVYYECEGDQGNLSFDHGPWLPRCRWASDGGRWRREHAPGGQPQRPLLLADRQRLRCPPRHPLQQHLLPPALQQRLPDGRQPDPASGCQQLLSAHDQQLPSKPPDCRTRSTTSARSASQPVTTVTAQSTRKAPRTHSITPWTC